MGHSMPKPDYNQIKYSTKIDTPLNKEETTVNINKKNIVGFINIINI